MKHKIYSIYSFLTGTSPERAITLFFVYSVLLIYSAMFLIGLFSGANLASGSVSDAVTSILSVETEMWDMHETTLMRSVWGFFHWFFVIGLYIAIAGLYVGNAIPGVIEISSVVVQYVPHLFFVLMGLQVVRLLELWYRGEPQ